MTNLHPDHLRLLSLARAALTARDNRALWRASIRHAGSVRQDLPVQRHCDFSGLHAGLRHAWD